MGSGYYVLNGHVICQIEDVREWSRFYEDIDNRRIGYTNIGPDCYVSTVFLGLDHGYGHGEPVLFETLIFGGDRDGEMWRYTTRAAAERGHKKVVEELTNG